MSQDLQKLLNEHSSTLRQAPTGAKHIDDAATSILKGQINKLKADKEIQESIENERQRKQIEQQEMQNDYLVLIINIIVVLSFLIGWFYLGKRKTLSAF